MDTPRLKAIESLLDEFDYRLESIGTQKEKPLHQSIKYYLCHDAMCHEFKIGKFIADIYKDGHITEIQTGSFQAMDHKMTKLLPDYRMTVVYPVVRRKTIIEIDATSGTKKPRKSPKIGNPLQIVREIVKIKKHLFNPNLDFIIFYVDVDEYRMKSLESNPYRKHERLAQYPKGIPTLFHLKNQVDYYQLLPTDLGDEFTALSLKKSLKLNKSDTQALIQVYKTLDIIEFKRKEGRAFVYQLKPMMEEKHVSDARID